MTKETEEGEAAETGDAEPSNPAAVSIALSRRTSAGTTAVDREAAAFLRDQRRLINLQAEHLHEQRELQLAHLRVRRWKDRMSLSLQVLTATVGTVIAIIVVGVVWAARENHGLVIDAFSVPSELSAQGLSGGVVAQRFLDKLNALQEATESDRPAATFQNNWGEDIKVEIPETGLKLGDVKKFLRDQLGNVSHVSGEVYKTANGVALTARLGDTPPQTFEGLPAEFDSLVQKAAESVYRSSQPYRFSSYLEQHGRVQEAMAVISDLATNGPERERGWAYAEWSLISLNDYADAKAARTHAKQGLGFSEGSTVKAEIALIGEEVWTGHDEEALQSSRELDAKAHTRTTETTQSYFEQNSVISSAWLASLVGDRQAAATQWRQVSKTPEYEGLARLSYALAATELALDHDPEAARQVLEPLEPTNDMSFLKANAINAFTGLPTYWLAMESEDWHAALEDARAADAWLETHKTELRVMGLMQMVWIRPLEALAMAKDGDAANAQMLIDTTPTDCYLCLRVRGLIATARNDWPAAERWFSEAARQVPSLPFAFSDWGKERLMRGDADGAVSVLERAHQVGPRFPDALELMGEALMRKGDYRAAIPKFRAADQLAPEWGANHLHWGESLLRAGFERDAREQLDKASRLTLSAADRAALDALLPRARANPT